MALIWRGMGIIVPILFFITGWIVSYWYDEGEAILGNASYIGWTSLFTGIVTLLVGLGLRFGGEEGAPTKKHDFFYLPVFVWGLLLGGLSLYLLVFAGKADDNEVTSDDQTVVDTTPPTTRMVHFYNPGTDTLTYIVADETADGLISREKVAPMSYKSLELEKGTYLFTAFNPQKETTLSLPDREFAGDETKYKMHKDEKGSFYQRILNPATIETDDYDEAWLVLNGKKDLMTVKVTQVVNGSLTDEEIQGVNWEDEIHETYDARDLMEPLYKQDKKSMRIKVVAPGEKFPDKVAADEEYYLLMETPSGEDWNAAIAKTIIDLN